MIKLENKAFILNKIDNKNYDKNGVRLAEALYEITETKKVSSEMHDYLVNSFKNANKLPYDIESSLSFDTKGLAKACKILNDFYEDEKGAECYTLSIENEIASLVLYRDGDKNEDDKMLEMICTKDKFKGLKLATSLMEESFNDLKKEGIEKVYCHVSNGNKESIALQNKIAKNHSCEVIADSNDFVDESMDEYESRAYDCENADLQDEDEDELSSCDYEASEFNFNVYTKDEENKIKNAGMSVCRSNEVIDIIKNAGNDYDKLQEAKKLVAIIIRKARKAEMKKIIEENDNKLNKSTDEIER